jgi:hypothetical protein
MEVHLYNPWLTYGIGMHRLREAGLLPDIFNYLDERPLTLDELHEFCETFFIGDDGCIDLPHPRKSSWNNFFFALTMLVEKAKMQWNPVKKKMMPWIDLDRVKAMNDSGKLGCRRHSVGSHGTTDSTKNDRPKSPPSDCQENGPSSKWLPKQNKWLPKQKRPEQKRSTSDNQKKEATGLQHFILTVPMMFPPTNDKVEPHEYFNKWKTVDSEAFTGVDGDELTELLLRGKLCSFFNVCLLHHCLMFVPNLLILLFVSSYAVVYF